MSGELIFEGKKYISSKQAAEISGYAKDYVGQLCRDGKVDAKLIGRNWYVNEKSILSHKNQKHATESEDGTSIQIHKILSEQSTEAAEMRGELAEERSAELAKDVAGNNKNAIQIERITSNRAADEDPRENTDSFIEVFEQESVEAEEAAQLQQESADAVSKVSPVKNTQPVSQKQTFAEREKEKKQNALLADTDIHFDKSTPIFYEDNAPLFSFVAERKNKSRVSENRSFDGLSVDFSAIAEAAERRKNKVASEKKVARTSRSKEKSKPALTGYALMLSVLTIALVGALTLFFIERNAVVGGAHENGGTSFFERFSIRKDLFGEEAQTQGSSTAEQLASPTSSF